MNHLIYATGATIRPEDFAGHEAFVLRPADPAFAAATGLRLKPETDPVTNTQAINRAIELASANEGGGTVLIPKGIFPVYTIRLQSHVTLRFEEGAVLRAARQEFSAFFASQDGEGGSYDAPELNLWKGIQDAGHSYFANSLVYGADLTDICIRGKGLFDGSTLSDKDAPDELSYVLQKEDPQDTQDRRLPGHCGSWFANKCLSLLRCKRVALLDFSLFIGGHFAILAEACDDLYTDGILIDTNRDAYDIDSCQNVTVRNSIINSLNDDALCLKAPCGSGLIRPLQNVLLEDCSVMGYDIGSVYAGTYTTHKQVAVDRCGPTGRVKFGTEATGGCNTVTVRRVRFERSRGFCLESCDGASMHDIILEDCTMEHVSSSPIFIRVGDRGRYPVTGLHEDSLLHHSEDVRLENQQWILPNAPDFPKVPAVRYTPCYLRDREVTADGVHYFKVINPDTPCLLNPANYTEQDGHYYLKKWNNGDYETDEQAELSEQELALYANAVGVETFARAYNIVVRRVRIRDVDPRYPILIHGLNDSRICDVLLEDIDVQYRGGLNLQLASEQRQVDTDWTFHVSFPRALRSDRGRLSRADASEPSRECPPDQNPEETRCAGPDTGATVPLASWPAETQSLPWQVNTFFCKNEALLPRADWDPDTGRWRDDPYNVPELPQTYPETSDWGILPAYGIYARHVEGLTLRNIRFSTAVPDTRHAAVFDDVKDLTLQNLSCANGASDPGTSPDCHAGCAAADPDARDDSAKIAVPEIVLVRDLYRRPTNLEYVPETPYHTTEVTLTQPVEGAVTVTVAAPEPGTPKDSLYPYETCPCLDTGYAYQEPEPDMETLKTVFPEAAANRK